MTKNNKITMQFIGVLILLMLLAGCSSSKNGNTYSSSEQRTVHSVSYGTITGVRSVNIEDDSSLVGPLAGGAVGGIIGNMFGRNDGRTLMTIGGAAAGALGGYYTEKAIGRHEALEITVELEDGREVAVVQDADDYYNKGDRVRIIYGTNGTTRVQHR